MTKVTKLGKLTTSPQGLENMAKSLRAIGIEGDIELEHNIQEFDNGVKTIGIIIPKVK